MANTFDPAALDAVIHGRVRLGMMAYLASVDEASFTELKARLGASDGNLSTHLRKLEDAGYVQVKKRFAGRKPLTTVRLSAQGRRAWIAYLDQMKALLGEA